MIYYKPLNENTKIVSKSLKNVYKHDNSARKSRADYFSFSKEIFDELLIVSRIHAVIIICICLPPISGFTHNRTQINFIFYFKSISL